MQNGRLVAPADFTEPGLRKPSPILCAVSFVAVLALVDFIFFRAQILNGFSLLFGDQFDGVIENALLEHWYNVLRGLESWSDVLYFYPYHDTLGYNDGYLIYGLIGSVFRSLGFDPFLSSELVNVTIKSIGFFGFFLVCRRPLLLTCPWSLFGASLFTLSHSSFMHALHQQLLSVSFAPVEAFLICETVASLRERRQFRSIAYGGASALLLGAWLLTAYYMAWFFCFFGSTFLVAIALVARKGIASDVPAILRRERKPLAIIGLLTALCLTPFLLTYIPKIGETGMHKFSEALPLAPRLTDVVQLGSGNFLFGRLYSALLPVICMNCREVFSELATGMAPILMVLFCAAAVWQFRTQQGLLLCGIALAVLVTWVLCLRFGGVTAWYLVYHLVPGAQGIKAVSRYQIFLAAPVVAIVTCYLSSLSRRLPRVAMILLCGVLLVEEINPPGVALARNDEMSRLSVPAPPHSCRSFFVLPGPDQNSPSPVKALYQHDVDAMMTAELVHLPTIDGFATFRPLDSKFAYTNLPNYLRLVDDYVRDRKLSNVCELNLRTRRWQVRAVGQ